MVFYNIFSKNKPKESTKNKVTILIDNREKNSLVASHLISQGFQVDFQQLPVADYIVGETAIERKTISDLKSSIINRRIMNQLMELKQHPKSVLLIEGIANEDLYEGIIHENAFRGFLLSVALEYRVPIIFTKDEEDTAKYLEILAKKKDNNSPPSIRQSMIHFSEEQQAQFILEGFPFIGPVTAKKLINKFKSLNMIFNASEEELKPILGKRAISFKNILSKEVVK